jgi:secreted trypsin-like serine protease
MQARRWVAAMTGVVVSGVIVGVACASPASAVANGIAAVPGQDPFAVRLTMYHIPRPDGTFYDSACSAALISPTWIITAGHCFHDINRNPISGAVPYSTTATLNTNNINSDPGETRSVLRVQQSMSTDVAMAQLSAPVTDVTPLAIAHSRPNTGTVLTLAGWGATSDINPVPATNLNLGQMKISSVKTSYVYVVGYAPARNTSACLYDSGAPYFSAPTGASPSLVSVESNGPNCPHTSAETTARTDNIAAWITNVATDIP